MAFYHKIRHSGDKKTPARKCVLQIRAGFFLLLHAEEFQLLLPGPWLVGVEFGQEERDNLCILLSSKFIKEVFVDFCKRIRDASLTNANLILDHVLHQFLTIHQHDR